MFISLRNWIYIRVHAYLGFNQIWFTVPQALTTFNGTKYQVSSTKILTIVLLPKIENFQCDLYTSFVTDEAWVAGNWCKSDILSGYESLLTSKIGWMMWTSWPPLHTLREFCLLVKDFLTHVHSCRFLYVADEFLPFRNCKLVS